MGRTRSPWRFSAERDAIAVGRHPFEGLPAEWMGQLVADGNDLVGNAGLLGYFDHFFAYAGPVAEGTVAPWTLSGATGAATVVLVNTTNGEIVLTSDSTSGCNPTLQLGSASLGANFLYTVGKRIWCFARVKFQTVASMEFFFGLATPDTAPCVSDTYPSDGIFFAKASSDTNLSFQARKDGTSTTKSSVLTTSLADATYTTIGFRVNLNGAIMPYQNGIALTASSIAAGAANIPNAAADVMQAMIGFKGASLGLTIDWVLFAQEL